MITDGSSNTIAVHEASTYAIDNGNFRQINTVHGWLMGQAGNTNRARSRSFNLTTIRYPPNTLGISRGRPNVPGRGDNDGPNHGLYSQHTGGVHVLVADGSVHFISNSINMLTLRHLSTRDDNQVIGEF